MSDEPTRAERNLPAGVEDALADALWRDPERREERLADLLGRHPEHADAIRIRMESLQRDPPPAAIGRYRILDRFGEGGMGLLYRAFDPELDRDVVIKTIRPELLDDPQSLRRFRREARIAGSLEHPGLCPVLDVVHEGNRTHVVMPLLRGLTLDRHLELARTKGRSSEASWASLCGEAEEDGRQSSAPELHVAAGDPGLPGVLLLLERVARAVHAAHEAGVVHRDLKPSNIMVQPGGTPVVLDFGLAARTGESTSVTLSGLILGSPAYMAPEQVLGHNREIDRRTDVYALGVILYEVLTLHRPYAGENREALYRAILRGEPERPRKGHPWVPRDVEAVCLRALAPERDRRYPTAASLADDLARARQLRPTEAKPLSTTALWLRRARRNPVAAGFAGVSALLLAGALAISSWFLHFADDREGKALQRHELIAAHRAVRDALRRNEDPPQAALRVLEAGIPDPAVRELVLMNALAPESFERLVGYLIEHVRGPDEPDAGIRLLAPRGAVVDPRPWFRFGTSLRGDSAWHFVVRVEDVDTGEIFEEPVEQPAGAGAVVAFQLRPAHALMPSTWRWRVRLDPVWHLALAEIEGVGEFEVVSAQRMETSLAALPVTGNAGFDRTAQAAALLRLRLGREALTRLEVDPAGTGDPMDDARQLLLLGQACALLGEWNRAVEIERRWRELLARGRQSPPKEK